MRFSRSLLSAIIVLISVGTLVLDIITSPYIQFPILFVIPVGMAAWYLGRWSAIGFAIALVAARLAIVLNFEAETAPAWAAAVNACINLAVLGGLAIVTRNHQKSRRALVTRVQILEGILPICSFCKKIRRPDGSWQQIETYVSERSAADFSHGLCAACLEKHYPEFADQAGPDEPVP